MRDPATLVCLGQEQDGPLVTEDSLQSLLAAHPAAFKDARAQLSFTPAGAAGRWGISLDVQGLAFNATAGTAVVQVGAGRCAACGCLRGAGVILPGCWDEWVGRVGGIGPCAGSAGVQVCGVACRSVVSVNGRA